MIARFMSYLTKSWARKIRFPRYIGESAIGDDVAEPNIENEDAFRQDLSADALSDDNTPKENQESAKKKSRKDEQEVAINKALVGK